MWSVNFLYFSELCDSQMSSHLLGMLKSMRDDESLCDVKLCVVNTSIKYPAHKVVLAAASPYFRYERPVMSLLIHVLQIKSPEKLTISLDDEGLHCPLCILQENVQLRIEGDARWGSSFSWHSARNSPGCDKLHLHWKNSGIHSLELMLPLMVELRFDDYFYWIWQIDETLVDGLLDAADLTQLPSLRNLCLWWLTSNLTPRTCLGVYVLALLRLHLDLAQSAKEYAIEHFREVSEGEEFLHISPEYLSVFLDSPYLGCDSDGQLLKVSQLSPMHLLDSKIWQDCNA